MTFKLFVIDTHILHQPSLPWPRHRLQRVSFFCYLNLNLLTTTWQLQQRLPTPHQLPRHCRRVCGNHKFHKNNKCFPTLGQMRLETLRLEPQVCSFSPLLFYLNNYTICAETAMTTNVCQHQTNTQHQARDARSRAPGMSLLFSFISTNGFFIIRLCVQKPRQRWYIPTNTRMDGARDVASRGPRYVFF